MVSDVLDLELHGRGNSLPLINPQTRQPLPIPEELLARVDEEVTVYSVSADGQRSTRLQAPQSGFLALHGPRPCQITAWAK